MDIDNIKSIVDKADEVKRKLDKKRKEMDLALLDLGQVQKRISALGHDIEKLEFNLEEVENELRPTMHLFLQS